MRRGISARPDCSGIRPRKGRRVCHPKRYGWGVLVLLAMVLSPASLRAADVPVIAAASSLKFALTEVIALYRAETGKRVRVVYGSSGNFARQIVQGAPFELFLSADEDYVRRLSRNGYTEGDGVVYAQGRIAFYCPHGSPVSPDPGLADLGRAVADGRLAKLAIANPLHAPYGRAAREVLISAGLWDRLRDRLVFGESAAQAARFAMSGSAQGGFVPYALASTPSMSEHGTYTRVPSHWHGALRHRMVLSRDAGESARRFYAFILTNRAVEVFERFGFEKPR
jgi:molybdate transport system substrate-binding protein